MPAGKITLISTQFQILTHLERLTGENRTALIKQALDNLLEQYDYDT